MKLEELSLNTKVEIDTKHQGFYGYKTKKINQSKDNNKTIKKHNRKTKITNQYPNQTITSGT